MKRMSGDEQRIGGKARRILEAIMDAGMQSDEFKQSS